MRKFGTITGNLFVCLAVSALLFAGCWDENHPGTYYTFEGKTIASNLMDNPDYSDFVRVLERANILNDLKVYGHNTCFAPDNNAIAEFLREREIFARKAYNDNSITYTTVDDLPKVDCDTLAWTHLLDIDCYIGDLTPGLLPKVNLNDRFLILSLDSTHVEQLGDSVVALQRRLNNAIIVAKDDSCENGVVHYIDRCIDFKGNYVYDLVDNDPKTVLFSEALKACGFHPILSEYYDYTYKIGEDSVNGSVHLTQAGNDWTLHYWDKRKTCFTLLVPTDSIFNQNGIYSVDDMFDYAKNIYSDYNDVDSVMSNRSNPKNPLFRFLSYHILPFQMDLARINGRSEVIENHSLLTTDPEDYFTPYLPNSIMRISTQVKNRKLDMGNVYINRRDAEGNGTVGFKGSKVRGVKILTQEEMGNKSIIALNGIYHYIDGILKYDEDIREDILDRRMRIDCSTLSPDFITSGGRQFDASNTGVSNYSYGFKNPKNFASYNQDYKMQVRSASASGSYAYEGDGVDIQGQFDMYVKLPAVPHDGTWQLRLSFRANSHCGIIQNYYACVAPGAEVERTDWKPLGIPVDLRVNMTDPSVGWVKDSNLDDEAAIIALDKSMKNRGWLKGSAVQTINDGSTPHRDINTMGRLILMTDYITSNMDYYIRIKQILDSKNAEMLFDFIEWVPKTVYDNNEDKN